VSSLGGDWKLMNGTQGAGTRLADSTLISASCSSDKPNSAGSLATPCANKTPGRRDKAPKMVDFLLFAIALLIKKFQVS
jgi:hypothetical protein